MQRTNVEKKLEDICQHSIEAQGYELVDLQYKMGLLQVFIDKDTGICLEDCVRISRLLSDVLDVEDPITEKYRLEVSSPGPNRPLSKRPDYERFIGRKAKIRTRQPIEGQKNFKGVLSGTSAEIVKLAVEGTIVSIPFSKIARAQLAD